jgi:DNA-binding response OmpR family regulator
MAKILVADDEANLAELLRANLAADGHDVTVAEDGRYVLKMLMEAGPFDLVVLDLMMPWADGFDVLHNLDRNRPRIVVLTGRDDEYTQRRAQELRVDAYLTKPYEPTELSETVTRLLGSGAGSS